MLPRQLKFTTLKFDTRKQKGRMGVTMAISYFTSVGYTISIPIDDTQDYDLIIDTGKILEKCKLKHPL